MQEWPPELKIAAQELTKVLQRVPPERAQAILGGFLASLVGHIPDPFWERMMAEAQEPCGQPDCGCEKLRIPLMTALNNQREDFKQQTQFES